MVYIDDVDVELTGKGCPVITPDWFRARFEDPPIPFELHIPFGANESEPYTVTITSTEPVVAAPVGGDGGVLDVVFEVGDPVVKPFDLAIGEVGLTELKVSVGALSCEESTVPVEVVPKPATRFFEDFAGEADGVPEDFSVVNPEVVVENESLVLRPSVPVTEPTAWVGVGGVPVVLQDIARISFTVNFADSAELPVGRHGGVAFCRSEPTTRGGPGYTFDFIDRDTAFRVLKDNNAANPLDVAEGVFEPGERWTIDLTSTTMAFSVDGEIVLEVEDAAYRSGYVGFWAYHNAGQEFTVDDVEIVFAPAACTGTLTPALVSLHPDSPAPELTAAIPFGLNLDSDYEVTVRSSDPQVAKPVGADAEGVLSLIFGPGDPLTQTFEIETFGRPGLARIELVEAGCDPVGAEILVPVVSDSFHDNFSQADGPPGNWTIFSHEWLVAGGRLTNVPYTGSQPSPWIWAGDLPVLFKDVTTIRFRFEFGEAPEHPVGRHAGVMFFAADPTRRWITSGYEIDWIDRERDRGYRFIRYDQGRETVLAGPALGQSLDPGTEWEINVTEEEITLTVDGEEVFSAFDSTYRDGFLGFWAFENGSTVFIDDVEVSGEGTGGVRFVRGDVNADGSHNIADAVAALGYLFGGGSVPCLEAADANDDGALNIADPITLLQYLFAGGDPPPSPFEACGTDDTPPALGCDAFEPCL